MITAMTLTPFNLYIPQGADFYMTFQLMTDDTNTPIDITNVVWKGQLRTYYTSIAYLDFTITPVAPLTNGTVVVSIPASQTLQLNDKQYLYDIFGTDTVQNITQRFLFGTAFISLRVTH